MVELVKNASPLEAGDRALVARNGQPEMVTLGTAATRNEEYFATAGQGGLAETALQGSNNLSDVSDTSASRTNLGLGNSATRDVGTTIGTVATGDDSRFDDSVSHIASTSNPHSVTKAQVGLGDVDNVSAASLRDRSTHTGTQPHTTITGLGTMATQATGTNGSQFRTNTQNDSRFAQLSNNLSDLADAETARTNLGLGGQYATRAAFEDAVAGGYAPADGTVVFADGISYVASPGATDEAGLPGWVRTPSDGRATLYVQTVAELKGLATTPLENNQRVEVGEYHAGTNRGGGAFILDKASSATDNGGTIFAPNSGSGRWLRIFDKQNTIHIDWFGAKGESTGGGSGATDSAFDDTPAFKDALEYIRSVPGDFILNLGTGGYKITDELRVSDMNGRFTIQGMGRELTVIHPTPFGVDKGLFRTFNEEIATGFRVDGLRISRAIQNKNHPICFYFPDAGRVRLTDVQVSAIGNTAIWANRLFNDEWADINVFSCGHQPLQFDVPSSTKATIVNGSPDITLNEDYFTAAHVGKIIYVQQATIGSGVPSNSGMAATILSVSGPRDATLDRPSYISGSNRSISFDIVRGAISNSSSTLTFNADCLDADDVGRWLYIDGAGPDKGLLVAQISSVNSASTATLTKSANTTISDGRVFFTPNVVIGTNEFDTNTAFNDHVISNILLETPRGMGLLASGGLNFYMNNYKYHGRNYTQNNFYAGPALFLNNVTKMVVKTIEWEFGQHALDSGYIIMTGRRGQLDVDGITLNAPCHGAYFADFRVSDTEATALHIGSIITNRRWSLDAGLVNTTHLNVWERNVRCYGPISGQSLGDEAGTLETQQIGGWVTAMYRMPDDTAVSLRPPPNSDLGMFADIITNNLSSHGRIWLRSAPDSTSRLLYGESRMNRESIPLTGTDGADDKLNFSFSGGLLYIENRTGNTMSVKVCLTG